jgi:hypothetical protein
MLDSLMSVLDRRMLMFVRRMLMFIECSEFESVESVACVSSVCLASVDGVSSECRGCV